MALIFVFGSNLAGIHGAGSARFAFLKYGAIIGYGEGRQGNSYAIPTKDENLLALPLSDVKLAVDRFLDHARENPSDDFHMVKVGCGLAGFKESQIAPLFKGAPPNVLQPDWEVS